MNPLEAAVQKLRAAPPGARRSEIVRLARRWRQPCSRFARAAARALTIDSGFPTAMSREIIRRLLRKMTPAALRRFRQAGARHFKTSDRVAGVVAPANVPDPALVNTLLCFLHGAGVFLKPSDRAPRFGAVFAAALRRDSALFGPAVRLSRSREEFYRRASSFDLVIASGNDRSLTEIRGRLGERTRVVGLGRRVSAAIVFASALRGRGLIRAARACAGDVWIYDQRGCFSPRIFFVQGDPEKFAGAVGAELKILMRRHGPVRRPYEEASERRVFTDRLWASALGVRGPRILSGAAEDSGPVVYIADKARAGASGQVVGIRGFRRSAELAVFLRPLRRHLQCVGVGGTRAETRRVASLFARSSVKWIAPLGRMQDPPLDVQI